jgi:hypothetical protein
MSPGVLLSTGYIAGGAIAGVLIAFLSFSDKIPALLSTWQYRTVAVTQQKPLEQVYRDIAHQEITSSAEPLSGAQQNNLASLNSIMIRELARASGNASTFKPDPDQLASQMSRLAADERVLLQITRTSASDAAAKSELMSSARTLAEASEIAALNADLQPGSAATVRSTARRAPEHRLQSLINASPLHKFPELTNDCCLIARIHCEIGMLPIAQDAEPLKLFTLNDEKFLRILPAESANGRGIERLFLVAEFFENLMLDR